MRPSLHGSRPCIQIWPAHLFPIPYYRTCLGLCDRLGSILTWMQESISLTDILCTARKRDIIIQIKLREHHENGIQLGTQKSPLSDICIRVAILANLVSKVSNSRFNCPLSITRKWADTSCFRCDMS